MIKRLSQEDINKIALYKNDFAYAQKLTGVPWQLITAVWYRESFSTANPLTPGGPFQFDPIPNEVHLRSMLISYCIPCTPEFADAMVGGGVAYFKTAMIFAACWLKHVCNYKLAIDHSDAAIKDALYGYNGRNYGSVDHSPYVMNFYDEGHSEMIVAGTIPDKDHPGHRIWIRNHNEQIGAFVVYRQLIEAKL